jgi:hypothetical protein
MITGLRQDPSIEQLTAQAQAVLDQTPPCARAQFKLLLLQANQRDATDEQVREALSSIIQRGRHVTLTDDSLFDPDDQDGGDDDAGARLLWHTISAPDFQPFIEEHLECVKFLI